MRNWQEDRHLRRVDRTAHPHRAAPYRRARASSPRIGREAARARRSPMPGSTPVDRSDRAGDLDAGQHLSGDGGGACRTSSASPTARLFDLQAVCSGFIFASRPPLTACCARAGKRALVIGAETFSRILDWTDRGTCVLFGDGAGAVVLDAQEQPGSSADCGVPPPICAATAGTRTSYTSMAGRPRPDRGLSPHGGPRSVQACGGHDHRRDRGRLRGHRQIAEASTGSCRTRPTSE